MPLERKKVIKKRRRSEEKAYEENQYFYRHDRHLKTGGFEIAP
jgi:hypothetical protein